MEKFRSILLELLVDLQAQKLRSFLTMFGIIWGTVTIVVLVAFGVGFRKQTVANMHGIGEGVAILWPGRTAKPWEGYGIGRYIPLVEEDATLITANVSGIAAVSPEYSQDTTVRYGKNIMTPLVTGVNERYGSMRNIIAEPGGRYLNIFDVHQRRRVVVIGNKVKDILFGNDDAVGKSIFIGETPFTVIGVMQKKTQPSSYNRRDEERVFIPLTTYTSMFGDVYIHNLIYQVADPRQGKDMEHAVRAVLAAKYKFDPTDKDAASVWDTTEFDRLAFYIFLGINIFLAMIGSFTLGVAGLGVANIMFIVVQERVMEIGIKRAVGATRNNILFQFFMETFAIVGCGSIVGFLLAEGIVALLARLPIKEYVGTPEISMEVVIITIAVLSAVGLFAGLMPARRASNLDVIECLRGS